MLGAVILGTKTDEMMEVRQLSGSGLEVPCLLKLYQSIAKVLAGQRNQSC